ncbi:hypothetical protein KJ966_18795 [bacterium]|nr:hypothetical protein [bacterium]
MKRFIERFEAMAMAVAFAEAGEWETAQNIMKKQEKSVKNAKKTDIRKKDKRPRMHV